MEWTTTSTMLSHLRDYQNQDAWVLFVGRFRGPLTRFAHRLGVASADAEDVAQETLLDFARAYREGKYERNRGRLRHWLFGIAYRRALRARGARRELNPAEPEDGTGFFEAAPDEGEARSAWEQEWERTVLSVCLDRVRSEVESATFQAFELVVRHGLQPADAAKELGVSVTAIYNAKHRVVKRLRELSEEYDDE